MAGPAGIKVARQVLTLGEGWRLRERWCVTCPTGCAVLADVVDLSRYGCSTQFCRTLIWIPDPDSAVGWDGDPAQLCWDADLLRWTNDAITFGKSGTITLSVAPVLVDGALDRFEVRIQLPGHDEQLVATYLNHLGNPDPCPGHLWFDFPPGNVVADYPAAGDVVQLSGVLGEAGIPGDHLPPLVNVYLQLPDCAGTAYELCLPLYYVQDGDLTRPVRGGWYGSFWWESRVVRLWIDHNGSSGPCCPDPRDGSNQSQSTDYFDLHFLAYRPTGEARFVATGSHSWTCPGGVTAVTVTALGAGGAGGGNSGVAKGGGGGGGGWAVRHAVAVTPTSSYSLTVGKGGVYAPGPGESQDGGDSTFTGDSQSVTGGGGTHGEDAPPGTGGAGGTATGDTTFAGWPGHDGTVDGQPDGAGGLAGGPNQQSYGKGGDGGLTTGGAGKAGLVLIQWGDQTPTDSPIKVRCADVQLTNASPGPEAARYAPLVWVSGGSTLGYWDVADLGSFWAAQPDGLGIDCEGGAPSEHYWYVQMGSYFTTFVMPGDDYNCGVGSYPRLRTVALSAGGVGAITGLTNQYETLELRYGIDTTTAPEQSTNLRSCCDYLPLQAVNPCDPLAVPRTLRLHCQATGDGTLTSDYLWIELEYRGDWDGATATWVYDHTVPAERIHYPKLGDPNAYDYDHPGLERIKVQLTWTAGGGWVVRVWIWGWRYTGSWVHDVEAEQTVTALAVACFPFAVTFTAYGYNFRIDDTAAAHRATPITSITVEFAELCYPPDAYVGQAWHDAACGCEELPTFCPMCADLGVAQRYYHIYWSGKDYWDGNVNQGPPRWISFNWEGNCAYRGLAYDPWPAVTAYILRLFTTPSGDPVAAIFPATGAGSGTPLYASTTADFVAWDCQTTLTLHRQYASGTDPDTIDLVPGIGTWPPP